MASQTITLASSFTPKLATSNSPIPAVLPLPTPRTLSCSSSLRTPSLKASHGGLSVSRKSHFKCYASTKDGVAVLNGAGTIVFTGEWESISDVDSNTKVQALGQFAVTEHNTEAKTDIKFIRVVEAERQLVSGTNYRLWIEGADGTVNKVYKALVFIPLPVQPPNELKSFDPVEWGK